MFEELDLDEARWFEEETREAGSPEEIALRATPGLYDMAGEPSTEAKAAQKQLEALGNAAYRVVPPRYEAYGKVLHPIFELADVADRNLTWDEWEQLEQGVEPPKIETGNEGRDSALRDVLAQSTLWKGGAPEGSRGVRVSWSELCSRYGVASVPELSGNSFRKAFGTSWPRYLVGPAEGELAEDELGALSEALEGHSGPEVFVYFDLLKTGAADASYESRVFHGQFSELPALVHRLNYGSPSALWPPNRDWFVVTDWDLEFTLIGGSSALVNDVIARPELEALRISAETRIDYRADKANA